MPCNFIIFEDFISIKSIVEIFAWHSNVLVFLFYVSVDLDQEFLVRRICQYMLCFRTSMEAELSSSTRERKEFFKVQRIFRQEDSIVDVKACKCLGALLLNKSSKHELEMVCGIEFRGGGARREVGVSLATVFSEESIEKLTGVLNRESKNGAEKLC